MRELLDGVFTWAWFSEPHGYDFNGHLVAHPDGNICVDPVTPPEGVLDSVTAKGAATIILTNRNHSRAANAFRERTGARVLVHPADAPHARAQGTVIDGDLAVGARIGPFTVTDASGKSPGEIALFWPERRILLVGDAVIGNPPGRCGLLPDRVVDDPAALRRRVRTLLELDFDTLLVGDGTPILTGAKARLQELVAGFPVMDVGRN